MEYYHKTCIRGLASSPWPWTSPGLGVDMFMRLRIRACAATSHPLGIGSVLFARVPGLVLRVGL